MVSLLDYVGTDSRVGRMNNIWERSLFFYSKVGEGTFSELSPNRINFSGSTNFLGATTGSFNLRVELLNDTRCNVSFLGINKSNTPYSVQNSIFTAYELDTGLVLSISRYNNVETWVEMAARGAGFLGRAWHIQPV